MAFVTLYIIVLIGAASCGGVVSGYEARSVVLTDQMCALWRPAPVEGSVPQPRAPNFQYFERPNYRYPYYDESGKGKLLYGYGGPDLYQYKSYSPLEGIH